MKGYNRSIKGFVLIHSLVLFMVASLISIYLIHLSREMVSMSKRIVDKTTCELKALSMLELIKYIGITSEFKGSYILNTKLNGFPAKVPLDGSSIHIGNDVELSLIDMGSKLNLYMASRNNIRRLFYNLGIEFTKADIAYDSFKDWVDKDNYKRINGAEEYYYKVEKGLPYGPRNSKFIQDIEEIKLIRGWTKYYDKLSSYITYSPEILLVNVNTASVDVLSAALDIPKEDAVKLINYRKIRGSLTYPVIRDFLRGRKLVPVEILMFHPTRIVEIHIKAVCGDTSETLMAVIDFNPNDKHLYKILKLVN